MQRRFLMAAAFFFAATSVFAGQVVIKWGDTQGPTNIAVQMAERIGKALSEKTNGRIVVQTFPGSQMGTGLEMIEGVGMGTLEALTEGSAILGQFVPEIGVTESPYVWRDPDHLVKVMNGPIGEELNRLVIEKANIRILGTSYYGTRELTTTSREVRNVADMKNFKLRVPESEIYLAMTDSWGAKPTPMNFSELYLALKQNVVDGEENPLPTIESGKFFEVQKYLVLTHHMIVPRMILMNEDFWQAFSAEDQKLILECVAEGVAWNNEEVRKREQELVKIFADGGMTVIEVDMEEFKKPILEKVVPAFEDKWGKGMWQRIQDVK